jgi:hypothetical protein
MLPASMPASGGLELEPIVVETDRIRTVQGREDGVPLLLHGNLTTGRFWQGVAAGLADGHGPPVERAAEVRALLLEHLDRARPAAG